MAGETSDELARSIEHLRTDLHDDLSRIELQLAKLVPREVYDAHRVADATRLTALEKRADQADEHQRQMLRWVIGAVAVPILVVVLQVWLSAHGVVKP